MSAQSKQQSIVNCVDYDGDVDYFINSEKEDELGKTVIGDYDLAVKQFTPDFLHAINRCCQQAIDDPSYITTEEY